MNNFHLSKSLATSIANHNATINKLYLEAISRHISIESDAPNFQECLNDSFLIAENLRNILKDQKALPFEFMVYSLHSNSMGSNYVGDIQVATETSTLAIIEDLVQFQSKWSVAYTTWVSGYKSNRSNKFILHEGLPFLHTNYQLNFPSSDALNSDIIRLQARLKGYRTNLVSHQSSLRNELSHNKLFSKLVSKLLRTGIIQRIFNFLKK